MEKKIEQIISYGDNTELKREFSIEELQKQISNIDKAVIFYKKTPIFNVSTENALPGEFFKRNPTYTKKILC